MPGLVLLADRGDGVEVGGTRILPSSVTIAACVVRPRSGGSSSRPAPSRSSGPWRFARWRQVLRRVGSSVGQGPASRTAPGSVSLVGPSDRSESTCRIESGCLSRSLLAVRGLGELPCLAVVGRERRVAGMICTTCRLLGQRVVDRPRRLPCASSSTRRRRSGPRTGTSPAAMSVPTAYVPSASMVVFRPRGAAAGARRGPGAGAWRRRTERGWACASGPAERQPLAAPRRAQLFSSAS